MPDDKTTFADLGIPFPLFEAPVSLAVEYAAVGTCSLCGTDGVHRFELYIGPDIIVDCPACGASNALHAGDREGVACRACGAAVPFPVEDDPIHACYACLRAGRCAITKDTEYGMIRWEDAMAGVTFGRPYPTARLGDLQIVESDDGRRGVKLPTETMLQLLRTPTYLTWQQECWHFDGAEPMVYIGEWTAADFTRAAPDDDGRRLYAEIVEDALPEVWDDTGEPAGTCYVFRSRVSADLRGHWDCD